MHLRYAVFAALLLLAPLAHGQPAEPAHQLAAAFLNKINIDSVMPQLLAASRQSAIVSLQQQGQTPEQAGEIFDTYMLPELRNRLPELKTKFENILVADFTVPELQAILDNSQGPDRQSAAAKAPQLQGQFAQAGSEWGQDVGRDVFTKNKDALAKLGLAAPPPATQPPVTQPPVTQAK